MKIERVRHFRSIFKDAYIKRNNANALKDAPVKPNVRISFSLVALFIKYLF